MSLWPDLMTNIDAVSNAYKSFFYTLLLMFLKEIKFITSSQDLTLRSTLY